MTAQELTAIRAQIAELHKIPGAKEADILDRIGNSRIVRTTSTSRDLHHLLKNAQRQARRRTARREAKLAKEHFTVNAQAVNEVLAEIDRPDLMIS